MHNVVTWDHASPTEFRYNAKSHLLTYYSTNTFVDAEIVMLEKIKVDIPGYEQCWVEGIYHCLFCHGYEERGGASADVLAIDDYAPAAIALHLAGYTNRLTEKSAIYTNGNVAFVKGATGSEVTVELADGTLKIERFITHKPKGELNGPWVRQLSLEKSEQDLIKANPPFNETSVPGVFVGGDAGIMFQFVANTMNMAGLAGTGVAAQISVED
ncbi:hypothetical protein B0O99DRAFT_579198 [Bisporella sp. PMI_857]|nr:hypothetical protein B0O99DRAFT_579198 [Bisporella sp. PMI_857]